MRKTRLKSTRYDITHLMQFLHCKSGVEVGVDHGYFSHYLLRHAPFLEVLWSVDPFVGKQAAIYEDAKVYLEQFGARSRLMRMSSAEAAAVADKDGQRFDFCYIDGSHRRAAVANDLSLWLPLMTRGGVLAGHDYIIADGCGVIQAVDEFARKHDLQLLLTCEPWASFVMILP